MVAGETIHGHHLDPFGDVLLTLGEPIAQGFGGASGDHVEEPSRSGAVNDRCEIDDDSDEVRVAMSAAVFPLALVDSQVADAAEAPGTVEDQLTGNNGGKIVDAVPTHPKCAGDSGDGHPSIANLWMIQREYRRVVDAFGAAPRSMRCQKTCAAQPSSAQVKRDTELAVGWGCLTTGRSANSRSTWSHSRPGGQTEGRAGRVRRAGTRCGVRTIDDGCGGDSEAELDGAVVGLAVGDVLRHRSCGWLMGV